MNKQTKRIEYIDLAKGFCILLVVLFHIAMAYGQQFPMNNFFKAFRMPLYFFLSGFFFKTYEGFGGFLKRKINKLLIPFVFYYLTLSVALSLILYHYFDITLEKTENFTIITSLIEFVTRENFPNSPIWFLLCLFEINVFFYGIYKLSEIYFRNIKISALIIITFFVGYIGMILGHFRINIPAFVDTSLSCLPFFSFGYLINKHTTLLVPNKYDKYIWIIIPLAFAFVAIFAHYLIYRTNYFSTISLITAYPCGIIGTLGVIYIAKFFNKIPIVSYWGHYSIIILVTHKIVYQVFEPVVTAISVNEWSAVFVNFVFTMLSYLVLIPLIKNCLPYVTAQKDLIKIS